MFTKKLVSVLLACGILLSVPIRGIAVSTISDVMTVEQVNQDFDRIRELYRVRRELRDEKRSHKCDSMNLSISDDIDFQIEMVEKELESLGVNSVSYEDVVSLNNNVTSTVVSSNENWSEKTYSSVYTGGVRYEVTILTAESANENSVLYDSSSKTIHAAPGVAAGIADYVRIVGTSATGGAGTAVGSIYDAVCTTLSNLSTSTIIQNVSATYLWQCDTIMHYVYVKYYGIAGEPWLCYAYNEVDAIVLGATTNVRFNSTDHTGDKLNYEVYEKRCNGIMDSSARANAIGNAIDCFLGNYSQVMHSFVSYVNITGADGISIAKNYVCQEQYPGLLY